jgi:serine/threonine-protein kinase
MATVYLAHDSDLERPVAVKVLGEPLAHDEAFVERFRREARTAAQLSHPNVVQVFDTGEEDGRIFIVMEYVEGEGLEVLLRREGRVPPERARELALQVCSALHYAHGKGVVHRDVKPANLLLRTDGVLKVADFGIARPAQATQLTEAGTVLGTAAYLPPEIARGEPATERSDIYSLGAVLYELFTGRPPYKIESLVQLASQDDQVVTPVREIASEVPAEVEAAIMRALARDQRYRQESAAELAAELGGDVHTGGFVGHTDATVPLSAGTPTSAATVPLRPGRAGSRAAPAGWRRLWPILALVALGLVAALAILLASGGGDEAEPGADRPARVEPVPRSEDPAEQARNLADWIREHSEGG